MLSDNLNTMEPLMNLVYKIFSVILSLGIFAQATANGTMMPILPPEIPKSASLKDELNSEYHPTAAQRKFSYSLDNGSSTGYLDVPMNGINSNMQLPKWKLFSWETSIPE